MYSYLSMIEMRLTAQAMALFWTFLWTTCKTGAYLPVALVILFFRTFRTRFVKEQHEDGSTRNNVAFYRGTVMHARSQPAKNAFSYPVRMALLMDLDDPPQWLNVRAADLLTAAAARKMAGTTGVVRVLTHPPSVGYIQNPISVYYCYDKGPASHADTVGGGLSMCIAEVTNTPWGERVRFLFRPSGPEGRGESLPKALHVSPLMDMKNTW